MNLSVVFQLKKYDKTPYFSTEVAKGYRGQLLNFFSEVQLGNSVYRLFLVKFHSISMFFVETVMKLSEGRGRMQRFDVLIQQQLKLADQMIRQREEIQALEREKNYTEQESSTIAERKEDLTKLENEFERLISEVILSFEKTPI